MSFSPLNWKFILVIAFCARIASTQNVTSKLKIPLSKSITQTNRELYSDFIYVNRSSLVQVEFSDINKNVSYIIFQVHSHLYNVTVYNNTLTVGSYVTGTNVGLYYDTVKSNDNIFIFNQNGDVDLSLLVSVHGYRKEDPIPGGCNMEFPIPISPFMKTTNEKSVITIYASPAKRYDDNLCMQGLDLQIEFYMMYLPERDFDAATYFDGIKKMMTLENIRENGDRIPLSRWPIRRVLSAYPGTGAIYAIVATDKRNLDYYSVYIPTYSYGCSPLAGGDDGCEIVDDNLSKFVLALLMFVGVFLCFFGHRFFKTEMFLFGMLSGVVITYVIISLISGLDSPALIAGSLLSGVFFGAIWLTFWWYFGIPVVAAFLPALNLGFMIAAIMYHKFPGDLTLLEDDFNFWVLFIMIMILTTVMLVSMAFIANVLCCAVLGAYAVIFPMDFYLGSNVKFIIINTIRRATVNKFGRVILMPPFETKDAIIIALWIGLAVSGFLFQHYHNRGRPPFPPPPRSVLPGMPQPVGYGALPTIRNIPSISVSRPVAASSQNETTPLLSK